MRAWVSRLVGVVIVASVVAAGVSLDVHAQGPYSAQIAALLAGNTQVTGSWTFNNLTVTGTCTGCTGTGVGGSLGANQVAYGASLNTMAGSANLRWGNAAQLLTLTYQSSAGDGSSGFRFQSDVDTYPVLFYGYGNDFEIDVQNAVLLYASADYAEIDRSTLNLNSDVLTLIKSVNQLADYSGAAVPAPYINVANFLINGATTGSFSGAEYANLALTGYSGTNAKTVTVGIAADAASTLSGFLDGINASAMSAGTVDTIRGLYAEGGATAGSGTHVIGISGHGVLSGGTFGNLYGTEGVQVISGGTLTGLAAGLYSQTTISGNTATIPTAYGMYVTQEHSGSAKADTFISVWLKDLAGEFGSYGAYFWADDNGVYRVKSDSTFNGVSQAIPALYNPQVTKYVPNATNYERIVEQWESNVAVITTEKGGSGTLRSLQLGDANVPVLVSDLKNTGSAGSKKVVCVDTASGRLYASSTGTDCSN